MIGINWYGLVNLKQKNLQMLSFKLYHTEHRQVRFKLMAEREGFEPSI